MAEQFYSNASQAGADQHSLSVGSIIHWVGTGVSVALLAGGIYWAFSIASRDVTQIPVVSAQITPMREAPENPGGKATENQGLNVTQGRRDGKSTRGRNHYFGTCGATPV
jgi:hypothetical protein